MKEKNKIRQTKITLANTQSSPIYKEDRKPRIVKRIIWSGLVSLLLILIIALTLPLTILSVPSLIEYSTLISLFLFLIILLFRYFALLVLAYLYLNEYTFNSTTGFYPFISIIVPVYNEGKVVAESIRSLLRLDYSNYEIIVVNDGSSDDTYDVAKSMVGFQEGRYGKIKVSLINKT